MIREKTNHGIQTIEALKHQYPIQRLCRILGISRASYYKWVHYQSSELELENEQLKREMNQSIISIMVFMAIVAFISIFA